MEQTDNKSVVRNVVLGTLLAVILSRFTIASLFMTLPILLACSRIRNTSKAMVPFGALLLVVIGWTLVENRVIIGTDLQPVLLVGLYPPVAATIGSAVWLASREKSSSLLRRFFWASIPVFVLGLALSLYFASDASLPIRAALTESIMYFFPAESIGMDISEIAKASVDMLMLFYAPLGIVVLGIPVLISDVSLHKFDEAWQVDFANMKFPDSYVWMFFASWAFALVSNLASLPSWLVALAWNAALSVGFLYAVVGASILVSMARRKSPAISAGRIVFTLVLLCFIPVLNVVVLIGLPVLGVLETWVNFR
ncbi:MAG: hypothetical protein MJ057_09400 [Sphaerochaetaceae bacterium]|nr:hypothetical protein [Sphaerochaetaceae bacterium]